MKCSLRLLATAIALSMPTIAPLAATGSSIAQRGDPARWYEPADTPRRKYENVMKEASQAFKEALAECRSQSADRRSCVMEARERYRHDVAYAKGFLATSIVPES